MREQRWWTQTALFPGVLAIATSWIIPSLLPPSLSSLTVDLAPSGVGLAVLAISGLGLRIGNDWLLPCAVRPFPHSDLV
jgi:hypothetical protein